MAFYVFYIAFLLGKMFVRRVTSIKNKEISIKYFQSYCGAELPQNIQIAGRHFDNQFQLPMIYFITCITSLGLSINHLAFIALAWVFVVTRIIHSIIHLGGNNVSHRLYAYASGWFVILSMWVLLIVL